MWRALIWLLIAAAALIPPLWLWSHPPQTPEVQLMWSPNQWEPISPQEESNQHPMQWTPPNLPKQEA
jgi:hypothetical protein